MLTALSRPSNLKWGEAKKKFNTSGVQNRGPLPCGRRPGNWANQFLTLSGFIFFGRSELILSYSDSPARGVELEAQLSWNAS